MAVRARTLEFWARLVTEAEESSIEDTATRHGVQAGTLKWWRWKVRKPASPPRRSEPSFLPVVVTPALEKAFAPSPAVAIELAADITIRVPIGSDVHFVAALVAALRSTC